MRCSGPEKLGTLLLILGFGGSYRDNASAKELAEYFDYYAINLPGHGEADLPYFDSSLEEYARYIADYIEMRDLQNLMLVGHSLGGGAVCVAEKFVRNRLAGLVLANPIASSIYETPGIKKIFFPTNLEEMIELCRFAYYDFDRMAQAEGFMQACAFSLEVQRRKEPYLQGLFDAAYSGKTLESVKTAQRTLETETLYIFGRYDRIVPMQDPGASIPGNPCIKFCVFEHSGHCPHNEEPHRFAAEIYAFARNVFSKKR
jgi:pimeloyl-ACP methyl ester carboxylesterase